MFAPDYAHWHGMYEVADRFYMKMIPQAREIVEHAVKEGKKDQAEAARKVIEGILQRPEHQWFDKERPTRIGRGMPPMGPPGLLDAIDARLHLPRKR